MCWLSLTCIYLFLLWSTKSWNDQKQTPNTFVFLIQLEIYVYLIQYIPLIFLIICVGSDLHVYIYSLYRAPKAETIRNKHQTLCVFRLIKNANYFSLIHLLHSVFRVFNIFHIWHFAGQNQFESEKLFHFIQLFFLFYFSIKIW